MSEPSLRVGLAAELEEVSLTLRGAFELEGAGDLPAGDHRELRRSRGARDLDLLDAPPDPDARAGPVPDLRNGSGGEKEMTAERGPGTSDRD